MPTLVKMPKWGLTMKVGRITEWLHREGDVVAAGDPLLVVETDKATNDVPAPSAGVLRKIVADVDAEVPVSDPVAVLAAPDEALSDDEISAFLVEATATPTHAAASPGSAARPGREQRPAARGAEGRVNASPAARKRAQELGVDLTTVLATGPGGRITSEDVERAATATGVREGSFTAPGGYLLYYVLAGPPRAALSLVFVHGLGGSQSTWQMVLPDLAERYRVCALDLPGHGQSDVPPPADDTYRLPGLRLAAEQAIQELGLAPAVVVGHSLGGAVALQLALEQPELVRALVLVDSLGLGDEINPELLDRIEAPPSREEARRLLALFFHNQQHVLESGVEELYQQQQRPGAQEAVRAVAAATMDRAGQHTGLPERLGQLGVPVLVVWGAEDRVIPAAHATSAAQAIPRAQVVVLDQAGHVPHIEQAQSFTQALERFLGTLQP
jgi:pyruvate dehydrogenase E2 component (dihydrolipoamide acetyltransferase)